MLKLEEICQLIDDAMTKGDRIIYLHSVPGSGMNISVYPYPDEETLYQMYKDGKITFNEYRDKLGLPLKGDE